MEKQIPTVIVMIGAPASGKSSIANELAKKYDLKILSSDAIREELCGSVEDQSKNKEVFNLLYKRLNEEVLNGKNIIVDSTNINKKYRASIFEAIEGIECAKIAYLCTKDKEDLYKDNLKREHPVPEHTIDKFLNLFEMPSLAEGFDKIILD